MTISVKHVHPWIFVGSVLTALAACPPNKPGTTAEPEDESTTSDASTSMSTTTAVPTSSGPASATTGETTAPAEPDTTSSTSTSSDATSTTAPEPETTTVEPETTAPEPETTTGEPETTTGEPETTGGGVCPLDLTVSLALNFDKCKQSLALIVTVHNVGTLDEAPAGIDVNIYEGTDASGLKLATKPTFEPLPPGGSTDIVMVLAAPPADESKAYFVEVDPGEGGGSIIECDETNNSALLGDAACPG